MLCLLINIALFVVLFIKFGVNIALVNIMAKWGIDVIAVYLYAKEVIE